MRSPSLERYALAVAVGLALVPAQVRAQCSFDQPNGSTSYSGYLSTSLVRAFVSCGNVGGNTPNITTAGGVPGCAPVENFDQQAGSPSGGWEFHNGTSYGRVIVKRSSGGPNIGFPPTHHDLAISIKLYHIGNASGGGYASGNGRLNMILRATMDDYTSGDMTVVDFPMGVGFALSGSGSVSKTIKIGDVLAAIGQPRFPDCTSIEIVSVSVADPNGNIFATQGATYE